MKRWSSALVVLLLVSSSCRHIVVRTPNASSSDVDAACAEVATSATEVEDASAEVATTASAAATGPFAVTSASGNAPRGRLLIVGGGGTGPELLARGIEAAGGRGKAVVAVFGQASSVADSGTQSAQMWLEAGAASAQAVDLADLAAARALVSRASLIWFSGGDQSRLAKALAPTGLVEVILESYQQGAVVGGTSAGAAVMSRTMITGEYEGGKDSDEALSQVRAGVVSTAEGFGFLPEAIVDQHFLKRRRFQRLLACVLEHPDQVGIGIDERTAILVSGSSFEVLGESGVLVIDARGAERAKEPKHPGDLLSAKGVALSLLAPGAVFDLSGAKAR
jgi:cyanophycinase